MLNKNITISGVEETDSQIKIKDENGDRYSFFKTKKTGGSTVAFEQFAHYKIGETVGIGYNEKPNSMNPQYPFKNIMNFTPPMNSNGTMAARPVQQTIATQRAKIHATPAKEETNWDEIAVGKCQTAFLAAFIQSGKPISEALLQAAQARKLAEVVVYGHSQEPRIISDDAPLPEEPPF